MMSNNANASANANDNINDSTRMTIVELLVMAMMEEYLRQVELWCEKLGLRYYDVATHCHRYVTSDPNWEDSRDEENLKEALVDAFIYRGKTIGSFSITNDNRYCIRLHNLDEGNTVASTYYGVRTI